MFHGAMSIKGHLFDSGLINTMLDVVEHYKASYRVAEWNIGQDRVTYVHCRVCASVLWRYER